MSEVELDQPYCVSSVYERDRKLLEFLEHLGIRPGTRLKVRTRNYDGTLSLAVEKNSMQLGTRAADKMGSPKYRNVFNC